MYKNVTDSGHHNYSDVSVSIFERLTSFMHECGKLYMHHCLMKIEEKTTFNDATARGTVMNLCVEGGMTPIQLLQQMQSADRMCLNNLCTSFMADLVMGEQTV